MAGIWNPVGYICLALSEEMEPGNKTALHELAHAIVYAEHGLTGHNEIFYRQLNEMAWMVHQSGCPADYELQALLGWHQPFGSSIRPTPTPSENALQEYCFPGIHDQLVLDHRLRESPTAVPSNNVVEGWDEFCDQVPCYANFPGVVIGRKWSGAELVWVIHFFGNEYVECSSPAEDIRALPDGRWTFRNGAWREPEVDLHGRMLVGSITGELVSSPNDQPRQMRGCTAGG